MSARFIVLKNLLKLIPGIRVSIYDEVYTRVAMVKDRKMISYIDIIQEDPGVLYMAYGHTEPEFRRRGHVSKIAGLITACAKLVGYKKVTYIAANVNKLVPAGNRPLSAIAGNKYGFSVNRRSKIGAENRSLNLKALKFTNMVSHLKK